MKLSYSELELATNGFAEYLVLGEGAFGKVYRASLPSIGAVAVKRIHADGAVGDPVKQFHNEVQQCFFSNSLVPFFLHRSDNLIQRLIN